MNKCPLPWKSMLVDIDGNVKVCCFNKIDMGNLNNDSVDNIWNNEKYQELRQRLKNNDFSYGCDSACPYVMGFNKG